MPGLGPGDGPGRRKPPKPKRKSQPRQEPSTEARKGAAFGSRPARPLPKPKDEPPPRPPAGDTKSDADLGRAKDFERTPKYREAVSDTYKEQSHARRRQILNTDAPGPAGAEAEREHNERIGVERDRKAALDFLKSKRDARDLDDVDRAHITRGIRIINDTITHARGQLAAQEHASPKYATGEADGAKSHNIVEGVANAVKQAAGVSSGTAKEKGAVASNEQFLGNLQRVEKATGPVDFAYRQAMKPTVDATSKLLEQTSRVSSASAGAALAASEGKGLKDIGKAAVQGAIKNDRSYTELAKKLGMHGTAAAIVGLTGDILFDPTTYASFGFTAPATAAERVAARKIAKKLAPAVRKAAKAGDEEAQAKLAAQYEEEFAAARRKHVNLEGETRGIQAGVRLPGGRQIRTKGRATAAVGKRVTKATAKVQESKVARPFNEVARAFAPHVREPGVRPLEQADRVATTREANALRNRVAREGRQLGKFIQRATGGDVDQVRAIVDAIESGDYGNLTPRLREAAHRAEAFHNRVAAKYEELTGKPLQLVDTILPKGEVDEALDLARSVVDAKVRGAERSVGTAERGVEDAALRNETIGKHGDPRRAPEVRAAEDEARGADSAARRAERAEASARVAQERAVADARVSEVKEAPSAKAARLQAEKAQRGMDAVRRALRKTERKQEEVLGRLDSASEKQAARLEAQFDKLDGKATELKGKIERADELEARAVEEARRTSGVDDPTADRLRGALGAREGAAEARSAASAGRAAADDALRQTRRTTDRVTSKDADYAARREARLAEHEGRLARAEALAARIGDDVHPMTQDEERALLGELRSVVDDLNAGAREGAARARVNDLLGAIRKGDIDDPELADALRAEDFHTKKARDLERAGNRKGAKAARAAAAAARDTIRTRRAAAEADHIARLEQSGESVLEGRAAKLNDLLADLETRAAGETPVGYVPRQTQAAMQAEAAGAPMRAPVYPKGSTGHEQARIERRRASVVREDRPEHLSDELPRLEARYGVKMGRRLGSLSLWKSMTQRFARPVTGDFPIEGDQVLYRVDRHGLTRIDPNDVRATQDALAEAALRNALGETEDTGIYAIPDHVDKVLQERIGGAGEKTAVGAAYDRGLRAFKAANTILRPGFFATTIAGNMWQQFLADLNPADMGRAWRILADMRAHDLRAVNPGAGVRKAILDKAAGSHTYVVDGRAVKFSDLFEEAIDSGAIRTGSRIGDPTELSLEEQAGRRLKRGGAKATTEWLGEVAEDLDDMTKAIIYAKKREEGLDPRAATQFVFSKMIDYSDLSKPERMVFKRVMPFYVYTARNLPIQVKSLLARPGKLANYEKVRQTLAQTAGLPKDWETQRTEAEQERMPVAIPGVTSHGFQVFLDPRLPVADLAAPAQLEEGPGGSVRMLERYASGVAPPVKVPLELLLFKRRLDYDRPIDVPGSPPAAGALLKLIGATKKGEYVQPATGEKYTGAIPAVDYLLRTMGGSPGSVVASIGAGVPDRSNLDPKARAAASFGGGFGVSASDPLNAVVEAIRKSTEKHYKIRAENKGKGLRDSEADIKNEDTIDALNDLKGKVQATIGFPEQKKRIFQFEVNRLKRGAQEPAAIRAERRRMNNLRQQFGG